MANESENFPLTSTPVDGSRQQVGQIDLSELESVLAPTLSDPQEEPVEFDPTKASRPDVAKPTKGPHRYTIYVPHDEAARINIGAPHPSFGEAGISARTNTHIGLWAGTGTQTALSLGSPATTTGTPLNQQTGGYAMWTGGCANSVAAGQIVMASIFEGMFLGALESIQVSSFASATVLGIRSVGITSPGFVRIEGGTEWKPNDSLWGTIKGVASQTVSNANFAWAAASSAAGSPSVASAKAAKDPVMNFVKGLTENDAVNYVNYHIRKNAEKIDKTIDHLVKMTGFVLGYKKHRAEMEKAKGKLAKGKKWAGYYWDWAMEIAGLIGDLTGSKDEGSKPGDVDIIAHSNVNVTADKSVSISGYSGVSISGFKKASLSSVLGVAIKGQKSVSVFGGMGVGLKALIGDIELGSDLKGVTVKGKKDVTITSEAEGVRIGGDKDVQLGSASAETYIHGKKGAYIGAGESKGYGAVMKTAYMTIGKHNNVADFKKTVNEQEASVIKMEDKKMKMVVGNENTIEITSSQIEMKTKKIVQTATANVEIKGKKVLLG